MAAGFVAVPTIVPLKAFTAGERKNHVDTATKIELRSDTDRAVIYYTVNGKRPSPFERPKTSHTLEYHVPFTLAAGKVTIKAMAVSHDGQRESSVVTKTFFVDEARQKEEKEEEEGEGECPSNSPVPPPLSLSAQLRQRISLEKTTPTPLTSSPLPPTCTCTTTSTACSPKKQTTTTSTRSASAPMPGISHTIPPSPLPLPTSPISPRCSYCEAPYTRERGHRYCSECGATLPSLPHRHSRLPAQMSVCSSCGARVQPDVQHCPMCGSAVVKPRTPNTIRGQTTEPLSEDAILCSECGTRNITSHDSCITCDAPLHLSSPSTSSPPPSLSSHPPQPSTTPIIMRPISSQSYAMCGRCGRVNVSDARFCDWCGRKPGGSQASVLCCECSTAVDWHARHCTNCGAIIRAPPRSGVELGSTMKMPPGVQLGTESWVPVVDIQEDKPVMRNQSSQTDRFYPSARTLSLKRKAETNQLSIQAAAKDHMKKLNQLSPGNGLWRVQVDHVCAHLKAYSQSSQAFQNDIGLPQMGKLVNSEVLTGETLVDIKLQFSLKESDAGDKESNSEASRPPVPHSRRSSLDTHARERRPARQSSRETGRREHFRGGKRERNSSVGSVGDMQEGEREEGRRGRGRKSSVLPVHVLLHQQLVAELGEGGRGRQAVVQELLQKGADVNTTDRAGVPVLSLAAAAGRSSCVTALLDAGASVDAQTKRTKNTALHEAVQRGPLTVDCIQTLLERGGSATLRNRNGETPCQLANRLGHSDLVSCFTAHESQRLLNSLSAHSKSTL